MTTSTTALLLACVLLCCAAAAVEAPATNAPPKAAVSDETKLLRAFPELLHARQWYIDNGWVKPGQIVEGKSTVSFSRKNVPSGSVVGEVTALFEGGRLIDFQISTDASDAQFAKLYGYVVKALGSKGTRSGDRQSSTTRWDVKGEGKRYELRLWHQDWGNEIDRYLTITVFRGE